MADIKFMDISENDNPATTDSILVGNKDNGLKRTTLGKLADTFAVHGLFKTQFVSSLVKAGTRNYLIEAPTIEGYQFLFWLSSATGGYIGATYIDSPTSKNATIWIAYPDIETINTNANGVHNVSAIAVYIKSSAA